MNHLSPITKGESIVSYLIRRRKYQQSGGCKGSWLKCYGLEEHFRGVPKCKCQNT